MVTPDPREVLLARFERLIDLPAFLGQRGYEAGGPTTAAGLTLANASTGDRLVLRKDVAQGAWSYANARDPSDRGTISTYLARRDGLSPDACLERIIAASTSGEPTIPRPSVTGAMRLVSRLPWARLSPPT